MPKEIRFSELVKKSGKPEAVTLWTEPKDNPSFMKAVRENRVLTVVQKPTGNQKDFGTIGFHLAPFSLYLVFPKSLPKSPGAKVIGIKYDLVAERAGQAPAGKAFAVPKHLPSKKTPPPAAEPKSPPLKKFRVTLVRIASDEIKISVEAEDIHAAETSALQRVKARRFVPGEIQNEIKAIAEIQ